MTDREKAIKDFLDVAEVEKNCPHCKMCDLIELLEGPNPTQEWQGKMLVFVALTFADYLGNICPEKYVDSALNDMVDMIRKRAKRTARDTDCSTSLEIN